jgi:hypothetical protein
MQELLDSIERRIAQNWSTLQTGQHVDVIESPSRRYPATIDEFTEDKSVVWVLAEGTRRAFDYREGVVIAPA